MASPNNPVPTTQSTKTKSTILSPTRMSQSTKTNQNKPTSPNRLGKSKTAITKQSSIGPSVHPREAPKTPICSGATRAIAIIFIIGCVLAVVANYASQLPEYAKINQLTIECKNIANTLLKQMLNVTYVFTVNKNYGPLTFSGYSALIDAKVTNVYFNESGILFVAFQVATNTYNVSYITTEFGGANGNIAFRLTDYVLIVAFSTDMGQTSLTPRVVSCVVNNLEITSVTGIQIKDEGAFKTPETMNHLKQFKQDVVHDEMLEMLRKTPRNVPQSRCFEKR